MYCIFHFINKFEWTSAISFVAGYVNIDCGIRSNTSYVNRFTTLTYVSDDEYVDTGENYVVADKYIREDDMYSLNTLRAFPNNRRNCYTLPAVNGSKYLVRAVVYYGNYDRLSTSGSYDLYFGVNFWTTAAIHLSEYVYFWSELIAIAPTNYIQVCLVNTGKGTPIISSLELRPLNNALYDLVHSKQSLVHWNRLNFGGLPVKTRY
jgi:Malectin-like domain